MIHSTRMGAPSIGRRAHRQHVTRRDLLAAGRKLFGEKGLYESRIEDVTRLAGIAKGTLYGYFANKDELVEAVVSSGFNELLGIAHREAHAARSHSEVVERLARVHLTFFEENPDLARIFHHVRGLLKFSRPEAVRLRRVLSSYLVRLGQFLTLHRPRGAEADLEPIEVASLLFGAVSGITSTRVSLAGPVPRNRPSRATVGALVALVIAFEARGPQDRRRDGAPGSPRRRRGPQRTRAGPKRGGRRTRRAGARPKT